MVRLLIKDIAQQKKISQSRLQRESGVTMPQLRRYWDNNSRSVMLDSLEKIARVLGVRVGDLFGEDVLPQSASSDALPPQRENRNKTADDKIPPFSPNAE